jgi:YqjK-like protein
LNPNRARALALRQQALLIRSSALRTQLGSDLARWQPPLALADSMYRQGLQAWHWLRAHPEAQLAAAVLVLMRPRRALRFAWRWGRRAFLVQRVLTRLGLLASPGR